MPSLSELLKLLDKLISIEQQAEKIIKSEKDKARREKIAKAFKDRDGASLRDVIFPKRK
jgi:hypothetical protein